MTTLPIFRVQKNIPQILSHLDLLVLATTTHEAFGRVIIEAQAAGVPVVATKVGGVVDIIEDEKNGLLVSPSDPKGMASAVVKLYKDVGLATYLSKNALVKVKEKYNINLMVEKTLKVYEEALNNFNLLIIKLSSLGDIILSTPALREIRRKFPHHKISLLTAEESKDLLFNCPYIDELIIVDVKNKDKGLRGLLRIARVLRKKGFDLVIDLQNNRLSHALSFLSLSPRRYGYDNKKLSFLLNHTIKDDKAKIPPVEHQFRILKLLGVSLLDNHLELWPSKSDEDYIDALLNKEWLSKEQKIIGLNISASKRWVTKCWPKEHIIKLCDELGLKNMRVVITGTEEDCVDAERISASLKNTKIINACGKTSVNQLAALIKRCAVYISADSSPLHIASAVDTPVIALFGPTDPLRHMPAVKKGKLIFKELICRACYKTKCRHNKCMRAITPEEVVRAIEELLK